MCHNYVFLPAISLNIGNYNLQIIEVSGNTPSESLMVLTVHINAAAEKKKHCTVHILLVHLCHLACTHITVPAGCFSFSLCDLTLMVFQSVGSHAEMASRSQEILSPTRCRLLKHRKRDGEGEKLFVGLYTSSKILSPVLPFFTLTSDTPLQPPSVCV